MHWIVIRYMMILMLSLLCYCECISYLVLVAFFIYAIANVLSIGFYFKVQSIGFNFILFSLLWIKLFKFCTDNESLVLSINGSTTKWLQKELDSMRINLKPKLKHPTLNIPKFSILICFIANAKKDLDSLLSSWTDLPDDP